MLALMMTSEGLPVGCELCPGNTWEGHTLEVAIKALEKRFDMGITCESAQVEGRAWQMPSGEWKCVDLSAK